MSRSLALLFAASALLAAHSTSGSDLSRYKKVDAYEIRPGILMMPVYNAKGQVCEIGLQPRNYSPESMHLDPGMLKEEIWQAFDELAPLEVRGQQRTEQDYNSLDGNTMTENKEYENVSFHIYSGLTFNRGTQDMNIERIMENATVTHRAAAIQFKNHPCK